VGEVGAAQPLGEAQVVLDGGALAGLPSRGLALDDDGAQALGGRVHGSGQAGRPAADDADIVQGLLGRGVQAEGAGQLQRGRGGEGVAVGDEHEREVAR
jgi:hypothetical protein